MSLFSLANMNLSRLQCLSQKKKGKKDEHCGSEKSSLIQIFICAGQKLDRSSHLQFLLQGWWWRRGREVPPWFLVYGSGCKPDSGAEKCACCQLPNTASKTTFPSTLGSSLTAIAKCHTWDWGGHRDGFPCLPLFPTRAAEQQARGMGKEGRLVKRKGLEGPLGVGKGLNSPPQCHHQSRVFWVLKKMV